MWKRKGARTQIEHGHAKESHTQSILDLKFVVASGVPDQPSSSPQPLWQSGARPVRGLVTHPSFSHI